jgi:antitoxin (DNA-binding transcriptional repressor) of toxin-antitoxin stability system
MKKLAISVTEAARNFAECVNRSYYQNTTFVLLRNGSPVARLVPGGEKVCRGRDLADVLAAASLPDEEAKLWRADLEGARKAIKGPTDKWR